MEFEFHTIKFLISTCGIWILHHWIFNFNVWNLNSTLLNFKFNMWNLISTWLNFKSNALNLISTELNMNFHSVEYKFQCLKKTSCSKRTVTYIFLFTLSSFETTFVKRDQEVFFMQFLHVEIPILHRRNEILHVEI